MPDLNWNVILSGLAYALLTGIFNLLLGHKSQVEAWAESNPGLAAVLKATRALGFDPWNLIAALSLAFAKKLPEAQKSDSVIAMREEIKAENKADADTTARIVPPLLLLLACFALHQQACLSVAPVAKSLPCDDAKMARIDLAYVAEVADQCREYPSKHECPAWPSLRAKHRAALRKECPQ